MTTNIDDSESDTTSATQKYSENVYLNAQNFSLVLGGPFFQLLRRARLSDDALMLLRQRIVFMTLFVWLPLLLLSAIEGSAWGGSVAIPFLLDIEVHVRFLLAMPLLIIAELVVHKRMGRMVDMFLQRNLIPENAMQKFDAAITSAFRLRNSMLAEAILIAIVYGVGIQIIWRQYAGLDALTWYAAPLAEGSKLSLAGMWYSYVSLPIFQFLLIRWCFRLFIWARFLWQVSRIKLNLIATHPDRVGGLSFLSNSVYALAVLATAHGAMIAGQLANRIFFLDASLPQFKAEIAIVVAFWLCMVFGPLLAFSAQLSQLKRDGLREYGTLAERYVRAFDSKWLRGGAPVDEPFVGSADIQSLADLGNSYEVVRTIRIIPVTRDAIIYLSSAVLLPILPLLLTMMPLEELLKHLFGILF
jgi:ABC-type multidrug transport system fused ATPase/permease subunit